MYSGFLERFLCLLDSKRIRKIFGFILTLIYPRTCPFCGRALGKKENICTSCRKKLIYIKEPRCKRCGKPIASAESEFCLDCQRGTFYYDQGRSVFLHQSPVKEAIYQLKYHNQRKLGIEFARQMYEAYEPLIRAWNIDAIMPVPLHEKRQKTRGYNQAELIALELGRLLHLQVNTKVIYRIHNTNPQKKLDHKNRSRNLAKAFAISREWEVQKHVLIIDDIYTTGSTINSMAKLLKKRGVQKVYFLTVSIGQGL